MIFLFDFSFGETTQPQRRSKMKYVSTYFAPDRGTADQVIGFLDRCNVSIDAAVYSLTHDGIADALMRAVYRGVKVRVMNDKLQSASRYNDDEKLAAAGVEVKTEAFTSGLLHHKFVIGDSSAVGTGSFNWTVNADQKNAENFVIIRLKYTVDEFQEEFDKLWGE